MESHSRIVLAAWSCACNCAIRNASGLNCDVIALEFPTIGRWLALAAADMRLATDTSGLCAGMCEPDTLAFC